MHASVRPYATAGVALVGASIVAVTPIAPPPDIRIANAAVSLAAASVANVPANLINAVLNLPAAEIQGMQRFADAMASSGSWNESSPNNVWGWDPANPEMMKGFVDMLVPIPALSGPLGEQLNWWAAANLPMYGGCAFECPDPIGMLNSMFRVPIWQFYSPEGYTFPEVINPVDGKPTDWSGQTVKLDPLEPIRSVTDYLFGQPAVFQPVSANQVITAVANLAAALQITGQLASWFPVRPIETFLKLFFPAPVTSTAPTSGQMVTLDASALRTSGGDVQQGQDVGEQAQNDVVAGTATNGSSNVAGALDTVSQKKTVAPEAGQGVVTATTAVDPTTPVAKPESTTPTSAILISDGNKAEPGQSGPKHRQPGGGLAGAVKSVQDTINSSISNITRGLTGGGATTGEASTGGTN
jgi:hypothetical protein